MISVRNLVKHYGSHVAVDDLSFEVEKGRVVGFLGPNGAGKSTTLRILAGFLGRTAGDVKIAGHEVDTFDAKRATGYMPEAVPLYPEMRVGEYLRFRAELKEVPRKDRKAFVESAMERAKVTDVALRTIGDLSKGYRQRVGLADALVAKPPLLILDEPTAGLDPNQMREVRDVIKALGKEHTVLLSTHILSEVEASCDEVVVINKGKLVARGSKEEIQKKRRSSGLVILARGDKAECLKILGQTGHFGKITAEREPGDDVLRVRAAWKKGLIETGEAIEAAVKALVTANVSIRSVVAEKSTLEDVFAELTRTPGVRSETRAGRSDDDDTDDRDTDDDRDNDDDRDKERG